MTAVFSTVERRAIAGRARTLHERLDGSPNEPGDDPPFDPDEILAEWADRFDDEAAFHDRLAHDGLSAAAVREQVAATRWPADEPLPAWLDDLASLVAYVEDGQFGDRRQVATPPKTPFVELLAEVAEFARARLAEEVRPPDSLAGLERFLVGRLGTTALRALYVEFKGFVEYHDADLATADPADVDEPGTDLYEAFVDAMFDGGFRNLCLEYPVLARQLVLLVENWVGAVETLTRRRRTPAP